MRTNTKPTPTRTHGGCVADSSTPYKQLERSVLSCLLWEDEFYENGQSISERISQLADKVSVDQLHALIIKAFSEYQLRHVPLWLTVALLKKPNNMARSVVERICTRPDQMTELLSLYWKDGKKSIPKQLKLGLVAAFKKFDAYQLAKWNRPTAIKLRDILQLVHPKPIDEAQGKLWKMLLENTLSTPDTWETRLSSGEKKEEAYSTLLKQRKMGSKAILMNMRNMYQAKVPKNLVKDALKSGRSLLPFDYLRAAKACPAWEDVIEEAMVTSLHSMTILTGHTAVMVDVSQSMDWMLGSKTDTTRMEVACGLAIYLREIGDCDFYTFSAALVSCPPRRGFALKDALIQSQPHGCTWLGQAIDSLQSQFPNYKRLIVITDEQTNDNIKPLKYPKNYILNVASYENGIQLAPNTVRINGFSVESVNYIQKLEEIEQN